MTVISTDTARYQPVATILDGRNELACGLAATGKAGATANATAYVTPAADGNPATYLIRVAELGNNSPVGGLPTLTVRFAAKDVTPPHIGVTFPSGKVAAAEERCPTTHSKTTDLASGIDAAAATWEFHDKRRDKTPVVRTRTGLMVTYPWLSSGAARRRLPRARLRGQREHVQLHDVRPGLDAAGRQVQPAPARARRSPAAHHRARPRSPSTCACS